MRTIVVATDFSTEAINAMEYAASLAQATRARIILFNSYQLPEDISHARIPPAEIEKQMSENREYLGGVALKLSERYKIEVDYWTNLTYVAEGLHQLVARSNAELVVMGMWKNAEDDTLFGNTTTFVIREASYQVLVVPDGLRFTGIGKILFSWNPNNLVNAQCLKLLKELAFNFYAEVQVFHVDQELELVGSSPRQQKKALEQILQGIQHGFRNLEEDDILDGIRRGVRGFRADLLVMVPHKPGYGEAFFYESRTREMALRTKVPLLVLPAVE